ncbi:MAG: Ig-like domain-containing protein [Lachnospiraceae bacterium]|nr:Ig-like domain-containing protein [Lachnospiraceae bacterium]
MATAYINEYSNYQFESTTITTKACSFEPITEIKYPSKEDIARKWKELDINYSLDESYEREVNHTDGGLLSKEVLQNGVDYINFCRYVAGLPADVIYDEEASSLCNATAELVRMNGSFSYERPEGITDEFYKRSCVMKNEIWWFGGNLGYSLIGSITSMTNVGDTEDRRHILNPGLTVAGFGNSGPSSTIYLREYNSEWPQYLVREGSFDKGYYHWPATNAPLESQYVSWLGHSSTGVFPGNLDAQTLYLSTEYDPMVPENITVQMTSKALGKSWTFTSDMEFRVNHEGYLIVTGRRLQFNTGVNEEYFPKGDEVTVTVTGTTINGQPAPITYTMNFFSIADIDVPDIPAEGVSIADNPLEVMEGESVQFRAKFTPENTTNKKVSWSVESADGIGQADITPEGILTGKIEGTVKVTATSESDSTLSDSVLVKITEWQLPLKSIRFTKDTLQLEKGSTYYLPVVLTPTNATDNEIAYESLAPEKVSIVNGVIQAIEVTEEPVVVRAVAGELYAECLVEVLEGEEERLDKNYDTRITDVLMTGESEVFVGETNLIKCYPVTNGQELLASEYAITINCDKKYLNLTPVTSEDNGCWYRVTGTKAGKQKISITMTSKVKGNKTPESVTKNILYVVAEKASEEPQEIAAAPVLVNSNITVNQNTIDGTPLDIRLIEGNTNITKVSLTSKKNDGTEKAFNVTLKDGTYYIQTKQIGANKKYNLICHIKTDQGTWEYPLNVTTKTSFPSVSIKQTIKPNVLLLNENAVYQITGKETIESIAFQTSSSDFKQKSIEGTDKAYVLTIGQLKHGTKLDKKGMIEIAFAGYRTAYSKKVTIATVSKKIKSNTLVSDVKKITLNSIECGEIPAMVKMRLQNSTEAYPAKMLVSSTNDKTAAMLTEDNLQFVYNKKTGLLKVFIKKGTEKGNYKFKLTGYVSDKGTYVKAEGTVSLTVVVATAKPTLTLKPAGNIDLIAREQTCVTYTPSMKDFAGRVVVASLEGKDAAKFYAHVDDNGKIKVYAKPYAAVLPKTTYELSVKATLENGYVCEPVTVRIKPKQSAFRAVAKQSTITLCRNEVSAYPVAMIVKSPVSSKIAYVKAVSIPQGMQYDSANKTLKITDSTKLKAGKTYKVTFEVTPVGAHRSIKPAKVTMKVKVQ